MLILYAIGGFSSMKAKYDFLIVGAPVEAVFAHELKKAGKASLLKSAAIWRETSTQKKSRVSSPQIRHHVPIPATERYGNM